VKLTQVGRPIPEEGEENLIRFTHLQRQGNADRSWDSAADHAGGPQVPARDVGNVHRATSPTAVARFLAQEFSHHQRDVRSLSDGVAVATVVVDDQILWPERSYTAYRGGFLSDGQMHGAVHQTPDVQFLGLFLKVPGLAHLLEYPGQFLVTQLSHEIPFLVCQDRLALFDISFFCDHHMLCLSF